MPQLQEHLEHSGIRATAEGLFEIDSGRVMVFVPRAEVVAISLQHGRLAQRPIAQAVTGAFLLTFGSWSIGWMLRWGFLKLVASTVIFPIAGLWMVTQSMRIGHYLEVQTPRGLRKLVFHPRPNPQAVADFVRCLKDQLSYP